MSCCVVTNTVWDIGNLSSSCIFLLFLVMCIILLKLVVCKVVTLIKRSYSPLTYFSKLYFAFHSNGIYITKGIKNFCVKRCKIVFGYYLYMSWWHKFHGKYSYFIVSCGGCCVLWHGSMFVKNNPGQISTDDDVFKLFILDNLYTTE